MTADFGGLRMKHFTKIIALISALCLMLGMLSGCSGVEVELIDYTKIVGDINNPNTLENLENGVVAENDNFKMIWNKSTVVDGTEYFRAAIEFVSKKDGTVWSTTPKEYYDTVDLGMLSASALMNSSLSIKVRNGEQTFDRNAYEHSIQYGRFSSVKHTNKNGVVDGITITYYFDEFGIVVGVDYYLEDDGFKVSVDPKNVNSYIVEDPDANLNLHNAQIPGTVQKVMSVTPAPFLCGTQNTNAGNKDSYFVIPSGSGALMYVDQRTDGSVREFESLVYGEDYAVDKYNNPQNETPITMPFYAVKKGNNALCAIIEQGSESCSIMANAGDSTLGIDMFAEKPGNGYSYLAASYNVLGYNAVYLKGTWRQQYSAYTDQNITPLVIGYYPLSGDQSNYTGVAKRYQKYLVEKEGMKKTQDNKLLNVNFYGSYIEDELFVGIPYEKEVALTTYDEATEILGDLKKLSEGSISATMKAYGEGGIDANKLAGGYKLTGVVGNKTDLSEFLEYTTSNGIQTFFDFDTVKYYESGNGYSTKTDTALNINGIPAPVYSFLNSTRARYEISKGGKVGALIARDKLAEATNDAVALADEMGITGLSFNTLGNMCYSDYNTTEENELVYKYPWRNNMGNDVKNIVKSAQDKSKTVLMDGAFSYAAVGADVIANVPTSSNRNNAFDLELPLYQIVFQGYRANSVGAINLAANHRTQFLKAIETGSGLSFNLISNYYQELRKQRMRGLHAAYYQDNIALIEQCVNEGKAFLTAVAGEQITNHQYLTGNVTRTVFENGRSVYVNYGDADYKIGDKVVAAQSFLAM